MRTKYPTPVHREIFIICTLALITVVGGRTWWTLAHTKPNPDRHQVIPSQVQKPPVNTNQKTELRTEIKDTPLPKVSNPVIPQTNDQTTVPIPIVKLTPKINTDVMQLEPQAYWLQIEDEEIRLVPQKVAVKDGVPKEVALKEALNYLLTTQPTKQFSSVVPIGTKLLDLQIKEAGIYINLSKEFTAGGGSISMVYRVAQVLYTASSIDQNAKVFLAVEGKILDENNPLGGEGVVLAEPLTRQQFAEDFSIS
jgi:spore germination protein GerM